MGYEVYIDIVFLVNFVMDIGILCLTSSIFHYPFRVGRVVLGGMLGAVWVCVITAFPGVIGYVGYAGYWSGSLLVAGVMVYIAFLPRRFLQFVKELSCLYVTTFILGGIFNYMLTQTKIGYYFQRVILNEDGLGLGIKNFLILAGGAFLLIRGLSFGIRKMQKGKEDIRKVTLYFPNGKVETVGFVDTGNLLKEPITGKPVIVGEYCIIKSVLNQKEQVLIETYIDKNEVDADLMSQEEMKQIRFIPYRSVGKKNGMMIGICCRLCAIENPKRQLNYENVVIALTDNPLSSAGDFFVLLHPELIRE